jgi:hypothetical protein
MAGQKLGGVDMLGSLLSRLRRPPDIRDSASFSNLLHRHAAFISQKGTQEFVRAKAGLNWSKLIREQDYIAALEKSRWEALAAVLEDLVVISEGFLRPESQGRLEPLRHWLAACYRDILNEHPVPAHRPDGWKADCVHAALRLQAAQSAAPLPPHEIAEVSGGKVYEALPIHSNLRKFDLELVTNNVRFNIIRFRDELGERVVATDVVADALGAERAES